MRFIFSHGSGMLPFLAARLSPFVAMKLALGDEAAGTNTKRERV